MSLLNQYCFKNGNYYLNIEGPTKLPKQLWKLEDFLAVSAPLVYDEILYISSDKAFIAINPENGEVLWKFKIPGQATIPVFKDELVFFGGHYIDNYI